MPGHSARNLFGTAGSRSEAGIWTYSGITRTRRELLRMRLPIDSQISVPLHTNLVCSDLMTIWLANASSPA